MLFLFLKPYLIVAHYGGHALVSVLNALHILPTSTNYNLYDGNLIKIYIALYFVSIIFVFLFQIFASLSVSKKLTFILIVLWLLPGILQITDIIDFKIVDPVIFYVGGAINQNVKGNLINAFLVVLLVWSIAILIIHIFKLEKKSKAAFDHIWYLFGLSALIFFILDHNNHENKEALIQTDKELVQAIRYIKSDLSNIEPYCNDKYFQKNFGNICIWVKPAKSYINDIEFRKNIITLSEKDKLPALNEILNLGSKKIDRNKLKSEIEHLNNLCTDNSNEICREVPYAMNRDKEVLNNNISVFSQRYILRLNALMPFIAEKWKNYYELKKKDEEEQLLKYYRWLFLMFLSALIGIKLAFTTREIFPVKSYSVYRSGLKKILKSFIVSYNFITKILMIIMPLKKFSKNRSIMNISERDIKGEIQ